MLDRIREGSQSFLVKAILVLIALTFALAGIGGYISNTPEPSVAIVNGEEITQTEFDRAVENERARQQQQLGDFYEQLARDPRYTQNLRSRVVNDLVNQKLLEQAAKAQGLRASAAQVKAAIRDISSFKVAGQFDNEMYQTTLRSLGYTPDGFAALIRRDLVTQQYVQGLVDSEFVLPSEVDATQRLLGQLRSGRFAQLATADYLDQVEVSDAQVQSWYDDNLDRFAIPEQVKVAYVMVDAGTVAEAVEVSDEEVQAYYEGNQSRYSKAPQYRFSHILIESGNDADAAKAEAEALRAELENGADFAELAAQSSDDIFSGEQGGDLDWIEPGTMDADFEEAAFALEDVGSISDVVESSFGYHIIKLTDKRPGSVTPLAEVRSEIVANLRDEQVKQRYYELQQDVTELTFEVPDTFAPVTEDLGIQARETDWFSRNAAPGALSSPVVITEVFSNDLINEGLNSDLIEISDTESVVVRVVDHKAAATKPLADVREQVVENVRLEQAQELALQAADELLTQVREQQSVTAVEFTELSEVSRQTTDHPRAVVQRLFDMAAPAAGQVSVDTATTSNGDVAIVVLEAVTEGNVDAARTAQLQEQLKNSYMQQSYQGVIEALRADAEIELRLNSSNDES
ncbi:Peptidyl-prolyl cis-trans isomerase D [Pseudidiomarina piscicola]|uniref:Periplasmic chaperone PpiD n=1 Tax=Pseudidiomarina piscicola TaxID=2614830 RepID=A0A6S6WKT3_9GAMM|nr:peptidylprolyl isomerase [Pseudidiomarina piscicola]CAB0149559.1 Peptidyl-prolyl cis-trans isomerase D [Pseudidiomarina piscicola]VZT39007.1 Peptidyl-prolyl cis-trans isomerase D [Pseudomonas aeruginosa]